MEASVLKDAPFEPPLLDLGCGDAVFAALLYPPRAAVGVELDLEAAVASGVSGHFRGVVRGDGHQLPFAAGIFQTVFSNCVLEHVANLRAVLTEIARVLKPGGHMICTVPSDRFTSWLLGARVCAGLRLHAAARWYGALVNRVLDHKNLMSIDSWSTHFADANMQLVSVVPFGTPATLAGFDALLWLGAPGHVIHATTHLRPFLRAGWWTRWLAAAAGAQTEGGGLMLIAKRQDARTA